MFKPSHYIKAIAAIVMLGAALPALASHPRDNSNGTWTYHSAFDNVVRRIMDTPSVTYFLVGQTPYRTSGYGNYFTRPNGSVFVYDKSNPSAGLQDFAQLAPTSGYDIRQMAVDPVTGLVVIAYNDGGVDLITPGRKVIYLDNIRNQKAPGGRLISSISFDPDSHDIWIGFGSGFMQIDYATLSPKVEARLGVPVTDICRVGDNVMAIIKNTVYTAPADADISYLDVFSPIKSATNLNPSPSKLMPLTDSHVGFMRSNGGIWMLTYAGGSWSAKGLDGSGAILKPDVQRVINGVEHTVMPTAKGFYVASAATAYLINRPETEGGSPTITKVNLPSGSTQYSASYDLSEFWFYRERGEFVTRTLSGNSWSDVSDPMRPDCPLSGKDMYFRYSPKYGFVATNRHQQWKSNCMDDVAPFALTAFRDGKWTNYSPAFNPPYVTDTDPDALALFNKNRHKFPTAELMGFDIDPLNPDVAIGGSCYAGVASVYMDDPRKNPVLIKGYKDDYKEYEPFHPYYVFPRKTHPEYNMVYMAGFDANDNMWLHHTLLYSADVDAWNFHLLCWPAAARSAVLSSGDTSLPSGIIDFYIPVVNTPNLWVTGKALRHPANGSKIVFSSKGDELDGKTLRIFDYNNTLDDKSDDTIVYIKRLRVPNIGEFIYGDVDLIVENPYTGDVILSNGNNIFIINPNDPVEDYTINARMITLCGESGNETNLAPGAIPRDACVDEFGRIWVAYDNGGVYGVNPDYRGIFAHYTAENSALPTNRVCNVGWNPETKSLFISSDLGLVEVRPDQSGRSLAAAGSQEPFIIPQAIGDGFTGNVSVFNVPEGVTLRVRDAAGKTIATLPAAVDGVTYWNQLDLDGRMVPSGRYTILDASGNNLMPEFTLPVAR